MRLDECKPFYRGPFVELFLFSSLGNVMAVCIKPKAGYAEPSPLPPSDYEEHLKNLPWSQCQ